MTPPPFRALAAPAAIGVSIIVATKLYVVLPMKDRLEQARLQTQVIADNMTRLSHSDTALDQMQDRQAVADRRLHEIMLAGKIVRDEGLLYQRISAISAAVNVSLERLDPQSMTKRAQDEAGVASLRCSIEAIGSYGAIAMFVRDLERELGMTLVRSVHIAPVHGGAGDAVIANIETEHFSIDPRTASIEGGGQ